MNTRKRGVDRSQRIAVVLCCSFLLGSLLGTASACILESTQTEQLREYIADFLSMSGQGIAVQTFGSIFWTHIRWHLYLLIFGFSYISVFCLPILFGLRGFLLTFSVGCFLRVFGIGGIIPGVLLLSLPAVIWLPAMWLAASAMLEYAVCRSAAKQDGNGWLQDRWRNLIISVAISFLLAFLCVFLEYWVFPGVLSFAARMIN